MRTGRPQAAEIYVASCAGQQVKAGPSPSETGSFASPFSCRLGETVRIRKAVWARKPPPRFDLGVKNTARIWTIFVTFLILSDPASG